MLSSCRQWRELPSLFKWSHQLWFSPSRYNDVPCELYKCDAVWTSLTLGIVLSVLKVDYFSKESTYCKYSSPLNLLHQNGEICVASPTARIWTTKSERWCLTVLCLSLWWYSPSSAPTFSLTYSVSTDLSNKRTDREKREVPWRLEITTLAPSSFHCFWIFCWRAAEREIFASSELSVQCVLWINVGQRHQDECCW